jgi:hypothetical protein
LLQWALHVPIAVTFSKAVVIPLAFTEQYNHCAVLLIACSLYFRRPLSLQLQQYAADDVRYLLPVATALLQQLPFALLQLSTLHAALGCAITSTSHSNTKSHHHHHHHHHHQQQEQLQLQLLPKHVRGYSHFMQPQQQQQQLGLAAGSSGSIGQDIDLAAADFELVLDEGTYAPKFVVYLREHRIAPTVASLGGNSAGGNSGAGKVAPVAAAAADVDNGGCEQGARRAGSIGAEQAAAAAAAAGSTFCKIDTAVSSLVEILPMR